MTDHVRYEERGLPCRRRCTVGRGGARHAGRGPLAAVLSVLFGLAAVASAAPSRNTAGRDGDGSARFPGGRWSRYVEGPPSTDVMPVAIVATSGDVRDAGALLDPRHGSTTLTRTSADTGPTDILLTTARTWVDFPTSL